jgi:hypothetical protein
MEKTMTQLVAVKYIGKKPAAYDNIARSGVTWNGNGDVQEVTEAQAAALIKFADQWVLADEEDAARVNTPSNIKVEDEDGDTVVIDPEAFKKPIEKMTKAEIVAYAMNKFGKELDVSKAKKALIDMVEEFEHELDVTIGVGPRAD